jgi:Domain of unknown function (DUF1508)
MKKPKVVFYKGHAWSDNPNWRWKLIAANGKNVCNPGEFFSSKLKAEQNFYLCEKLMKQIVENEGIALAELEAKFGEIGE